MSFDSRFLRAASRSVRWLSAFLTAASVSTGVGANDVGFARLDARVPQLGRLGSEDQRAEQILLPLDRRLGDDHRFLARRHFGFGLHDVERRHGADLDAGAIVLERLLRQLQRLPLHVEVADRIQQVVERVADGAGRLRDRLLQLRLRDLPVLLADQQLLARAVDLEVAQQRLRVGGADVRRQLRIEAA